jgi:hypothetical protein
MYICSFPYSRFWSTFPTIWTRCICIYVYIHTSWCILICINVCIYVLLPIADFGVLFLLFEQGVYAYMFIYIQVDVY